MNASKPDSLLDMLVLLCMVMRRCQILLQWHAFLHSKAEACFQQCCAEFFAGDVYRSRYCKCWKELVCHDPLKFCPNYPHTLACCTWRARAQKDWTTTAGSVLLLGQPNDCALPFGHESCNERVVCMRRVLLRSCNQVALSTWHAYLFNHCLNAYRHALTFNLLPLPLGTPAP